MKTRQNHSPSNRAGTIFACHINIKIYKMKTYKLFLSVALIALTFSACKSSKKAHMADNGLSSLRKELKRELPDAKIVMLKDSLKVIYPELALFDVNKDEIKPSAFVSIQAFAKVLKKENQVYFIINGHTDNVGSDELNNSLSLRRATHSKALFVKDGIDDARMAVNGYGSSQPVAGNSTDEGKQANRRVEFVLYKRCK